MTRHYPYLSQRILRSNTIYRKRFICKCVIEKVLSLHSCLFFAIYLFAQLDIESLLCTEVDALHTFNQTIEDHLPEC